MRLRSSGTVGLKKVRRRDQRQSLLPPGAHNWHSSRFGSDISSHTRPVEHRMRMISTGMAECIDSPEKFPALLCVHNLQPGISHRRRMEIMVPLANLQTPSAPIPRPDPKPSPDPEPQPGSDPDLVPPVGPEPEPGSTPKVFPPAAPQPEPMPM
jgi:hypothetical protein